MDVTARATFWDTVRELAADRRTVLFSTHQLPEAQRYADRIVLLAAGRVVADDSPERIVEASGSLDAAFQSLTTNTEN